MFIKSLALIATIALNSFNLNAGPAARIYSTADVTNRLVRIVTSLESVSALPLAKASSLSNIATELRAVAVGPLASNIVITKMTSDVAVANYTNFDNYSTLTVGSAEYEAKVKAENDLRIKAKEALERTMNLKWIQSVLLVEANTLEIVSSSGIASSDYLKKVEDLAISRNKPEGKELIDREVNNARFFIKRAAGVIGNAIVGLDGVRPLSPNPL